MSVPPDEPGGPPAGSDAVSTDSVSTDTVSTDTVSTAPTSIITPRSAALATAAVLIVLLAAVATWLPVPYVREGPGPTSNTIGQIDGKPLIAISGRPTYPTAGHLELLTVSVSGGPGRRLDLFRALQGWLDPHVAIIPEEEIYPKGKTGKQIETENAEQMTGSQQNATAAALRALKIPITEVVVVQAVLAGSPALGVLKAGDIITAVDGKAVGTPEQVRDAIVARKPGDEVTLTVTRGGKKRTETVTTVAAPDDPSRPIVGITPGVSYTFPFSVDFNIDQVGGPSAGQMFALGIIDKLTPGRLNDGKFVAGTGTIDPAGHIGAIGGIAQKMVAAKNDGAALFLAPAGNCREVAATKPDGLRVTKVSTLQDSLDALTALREGHADRLPTCTS